MDAAWFGLLGVVVGSVISTIWAWLAIVRHEQTAGMVAARLVDDDLEAANEVANETAPGRGEPGPSHSLWVENRAALATVLGEDEWRTVARAYRLGSDGPRPGDITAARTRLRPLVEGKRGVVPPRWRRRLLPFR